jgi:uncharacterized membrane protein
MITVYWVLLSILIALLGSNKKMGFWGLLFCSLFFSPAVGLVILLASARKKSPYKKSSYNIK